MDKIKNFLNRFIYIWQMIKVLWDTDRKFLVLNVVEIILSSAKPFPGIILLKKSIDFLTTGVDFKSYLTAVVPLILTMLIIDVLVTYITTAASIRGNIIGNKLFEKIFNKCIELDFEMLMRKDILEMKTLAMKTIEGGKFNNLTYNFRSLVTNFNIVIGIVYIISSVDILILFFALVVIIVNTISTFLSKKGEYTVYTESIPINRKVEYFMSLSSDFSYGKEVRIFDMADKLKKKHTELNTVLLKYTTKVFKTFRKGGLVYGFSNSLLELLLYTLLGYKVLVLNTITIGDFALYSNAVRQFKDSMNNLFSSFIDINNNGQYISHYFEFINLQGSFTKGKKRYLPSRPDYTLSFKNVSFKYPGMTEYSLKNISIDIKQGEKLSIVGENGSGKTTFVKLLTRLYDPTEGCILLNGVDIRDIDYKEYLSIFSVVFQDYKLFAFTLEENITLMEAEQNVNSKKICDVIKKAGLENKVASLENGLKTYLYRIYDDNGIELSGGESQKTAIARALYKDAPIVILDEPTAALDPRAEYEIYKSFDDLVNGKTAVYISHRLSSTRFCEKIAVFENGEIIEYGSHMNLLDKKAKYAELFNMQAQFYNDKVV